MASSNKSARLAATGSPRQYDIAVLGATGFTGRYICEHLVDSLPTDCNWAIAGRSKDSLESLHTNLAERNPGRPSPSIELSTLDPSELSRLVQKTRILITAVGPYARYGTAVMEACINHGTHYFDITGETPWVHKMVNDYHQKATESRVIMIPQIGVESAPADLLSWALVTHIQRTLSTPTRDLVFSVHDLRGAPSGGTLSSVFTLFDLFTLAQIRTALKPWSLSPIGPTQGSRKSPGLFQQLVGVRSEGELGTLTTGLQGAMDATEVYRSHGLIDKGDYYGPNFRFQPFMRTRNFVTGFMMHVALAVGGALLLLSPVREILKRMVFEPGQGPSRESSKDDKIEYRAIAYADAAADPQVTDPKRVLGRLIWQGSLYHLTGVLAAEGAITLLKDETMASSVGGGLLTPALLGEAYIDRLQRAGVRIDIQTMP